MVCHSISICLIYMSIHKAFKHFDGILSDPDSLNILLFKLKNDKKYTIDAAPLSVNLSGLLSFVK